METALGVLLIAAMFVLLFWSDIDRWSSHRTRPRGYYERKLGELRQMLARMQANEADRAGAMRIDAAARAMRDEVAKPRPAPQRRMAA